MYTISFGSDTEGLPESSEWLGQRSYQLCLSLHTAALPFLTSHSSCLSGCSANQITQMLGVKSNPQKLQQNNFSDLAHWFSSHRAVSAELEELGRWTAMQSSAFPKHPSQTWHVITASSASAALGAGCLLPKTPKITRPFLANIAHLASEFILDGGCNVSIHCASGDRWIFTSWL